MNVRFHVWCIETLNRSSWSAFVKNLDGKITIQNEKGKNSVNIMASTQAAVLPYWYTDACESGALDKKLKENRVVRLLAFSNPKGSSLNTAKFIPIIPFEKVGFSGYSQDR